jgi:hypothetical protein
MMAQKPLPRSTQKPLPQTTNSGATVTLGEAVRTWISDGRAQGFSGSG